jgi:hypothetical protein
MTQGRIHLRIDNDAFRIPPLFSLCNSSERNEKGQCPGVDSHFPVMLSYTLKVLES